MATTKTNGKAKPASKPTAKPASKPGKSSAGSGEGNTQLKKFFIDCLKDIYWAEKALTKALPKMQKAATTEELQEAIGEHLVQTEEQIARLEEVFGLLELKPQAKKCEAMEGLLKEGESIIEETEDGTMTRDVGIIMAAQKVEHYEIATYGGLVQLATVLGEDDVVNLLSETLEEEKQTDALLSEIAESNVNWAAEQEDDEEKEEDDEQQKA